jgi:hypothetical protein
MAELFTIAHSQNFEVGNCVRIRPRRERNDFRNSWITGNSEVNAMNDYSLRYASILRDRSIGDDGAEDRLAAAWA